MRPAGATNIKTIAVPNEHGASVMFLESLFSGLLIAISLKGFLFAIACLFIFLMSHPLKIYIKDVLRHIDTKRTLVALIFTLGYGFLASLCFVILHVLGERLFWTILIWVIPFGLIHLWLVLTGNKKELLSEISGVICLGAIGASIVFISHQHFLEAMALWLVLAIRSITSVVYVRFLLNHMRRIKQRYIHIVLLHLIALAVLILLIISGLVKPIILLGGIFLILRAFYAYYLKPTTPQSLGIQETFVGVIFIICTISAF